MIKIEKQLEQHTKKKAIRVGKTMTKNKRNIGSMTKGSITRATSTTTTRLATRTALPIHIPTTRKMIIIKIIKAKITVITKSTNSKTNLTIRKKKQ